MTNSLKTWQADKVSSNIGFGIKHFGFSKVIGRFDDYQAQIKFDGKKFETAKLYFKADLKSINTFSKIRDKHLLSSDYFDVENSPILKFESTEIIKNEKQNFLIKGELSFKNQTNSIELNAHYGEVIKDPWGNPRFGLMMNGIINREDWHIKVNDLAENGNLIVGKKIELNINLEMIAEDNN